MQFKTKADVLSVEIGLLMTSGQALILPKRVRDIILMMADVIQDQQRQIEAIKEPPHEPIG